MEKKPIRRLYRSREHRVLAGVAGGIAEYFGIDPVLARVGLVAVLIPTGPFGLLIYIVLALVLPLEPETATAEQP